MTAAVVRTWSERLTTHDGTDLVLDVAAPVGDEPVPALLLRTPYGRAGHRSEASSWARRGFAMVVQDVRGRGDSGGSFVPYRDELPDSAQTARWLAAQPWCDGRVVATGGSYAAHTAWTTVIGAPEVVAAVISAVPADGTRVVNASPTGLPLLYRHAWWWTENADRPASAPAAFPALLRATPGVLDTLPVLEVADLLDLSGTARAQWREVLLDVSRSGTAADAAQDDALRALQVPTLHLAGWHDGFLATSLRQAALVGSAVSPRPHRTLVIGPWNHHLGGDGASTSLGWSAPAAPMSLGARQLAWLREVLGPTEESVSPRSPDRACVVLWGALGGTDWESAPTWPPRTTTRTWLLTASGALSPVEGRGAALTDAGTVVVRSDPAAPVRSPLPHLPAPEDATDVPSTGSTVACHTSLPLPARMDVRGAPRVWVELRTGAPSVDVVARLDVLAPDGSVADLGLAAAEVVTADGSAVVAADLPHVAADVVAGSRLRLRLSGSFFPLLARNPQTGVDRCSATTVVTAEIELLMNGSCRLELPVAAGAPP